MQTEAAMLLVLLASADKSFVFSPIEPTCVRLAITVAVRIGRPLSVARRCVCNIEIIRLLNKRLITINWHAAAVRQCGTTNAILFPIHFPFAPGFIASNNWHPCAGSVCGQLAQLIRAANAMR